MMRDERLQKIIARSGLCSRRDADRMIAEGRVTVNGQVAGPGAKVDPSSVHIKVDGKSLKAPEPLRYLLLYKPREVMTTCDDPEERKTVLDIVRPVIRERVYPVGRLDFQSEGLLVLTNDGELAGRIAHPRHGVVREYLVKIRGDLSEAELRKLQAGTSIEGHHVKPRQVRRERVARGGASSWWRVEVTEGRTHEVRELFFRAGHHVQRLRRTAIGPLRDDTLRPGEFRTISASELAELRRLTKVTRPESGRRPPAAVANKPPARPARPSGRPAKKR
jgi:23S rRNA pseudouridine2605 synthase